MPKDITDEVEISSDEENSEEKKKNKIIVYNKCLYWKSNFKNVLFEGTILKNVFLEGAILKISFLRKQFILKRLDYSDKKQINSIMFKAQFIS